MSHWGNRGPLPQQQLLSAEVVDLSYLDKDDCIALDIKLAKVIRMAALLDEQVRQLLVRWKRANKIQRRTSMTVLRHRIRTVSAVREMFYRYARRQCDVFEAMQNHVGVWLDESEDEEEDEHEEEAEKEEEEAEDEEEAKEEEDEAKEEEEEAKEEEDEAKEEEEEAKEEEEDEAKEEEEEAKEQEDEAKEEEEEAKEDVRNNGEKTENENDSKEV